MLNESKIKDPRMWNRWRSSGAVRRPVVGSIITWRKAKRVARILAKHPCIERVEVFGSVAREGRGNDLDLILIVDEIEAWEFLAEVERLLEGSGIYGGGDGDPYVSLSLRQDVMESMLSDEVPYNQWIDMAYGVVNWWKLDIFLFPEDWKQHSNILQAALPHSDPDFMENIARDARLIA